MNEATFFGLPGAVTIVSVLEAKLTGSPASRSAWAALSMFFVSAEANTSAGAPWVNWVTRSEEPAKENSMSVPGLSVLNCSPISVNDFFNDAAAKTMSFPPPSVLLVEEGEDASSDEPHPLTSEQ